MTDHKEDFYGKDYDANLFDLYASADVIAEAESSDFREKWGETMISVPASVVDYLAIYEQLAKHEPGLVPGESEPVVLTDELREILGEMTEPFVDYMNHTRKANILQALNAYIKTGYLSYGMNEDGVLEYAFPLDHSFISYGMKKDIIDYVTAHARFS